MNKILKLAQNPQPFEKGIKDIWLDPDRADLVLQTHLDENIPGGSKGNIFIQQTVDYINKQFPMEQFPKVIDVACGPGRYSEKLAELGYSVTGIDYNPNAIEFAKKSALSKNLNINYVTDDIINPRIAQEKHNIALLIYHVYGSFEKKKRITILQNISNSLEIGGILIMDVLSEVSYSNFEQSQNWALSRKNNFISERNHLTLASALKYPGNVTLARNLIIFEDEEIISYNYWNQHFSVEELKSEVESTGFTVETLLKDVNGEEYDANSDNFAVVLKKIKDCNTF